MHQLMQRQGYPTSKKVPMILTMLAKNSDDFGKINTKLEFRRAAID
jgi:hypothetical protein